MAHRVAFLLSGALLFAGVAFGQPVYLGSDACKQCHWSEWSRFRASAHGVTLQADLAARALPLPEGFDLPDVAYLLGGTRRRALYLDQSGHVITSAGGEAGNNQYNLATGQWADQDAGEVVPFDCGACHTTGYSPAGHQGGLPGIVGTWAHDGVQCEACHGPASLHVVPPYTHILSIPDSAQCGACHSNGPTSQVPASGGFIRTNAQYNELLASPHAERWCVECHDPHAKSEQSLVMHCTECHAHVPMASQDAFTLLGRRHLDRGVECWDCHMPYAVKSATAESKWRGDARSHLFDIALDESAKMFNPDGTMANGRITAGFACLGCHQNIAAKFEAEGKPGKAEKWARVFGKKIHKF